MAHGTFQLSETNPNDSVGGGGCLCSEEHDADTRGPYIICYAVSTDSVVSPHVVVCAECLKEMNKVMATNDAVIVGFRGDQPKIVNPYSGDADQGDEVLKQRRIRAEQGVLVHTNTPAQAPADDEDDAPIEL